MEQSNVTLMPDIQANLEHMTALELWGLLQRPEVLHFNIVRGLLPLSRETALHIAGATDYDWLRAEVESIRSNEKGEIGRALTGVREELLDVMEKYPDPAGLMCALTEEVGELARAAMCESRIHVWNEAIQVAATAIRIGIEGDPTLNGIREKYKADVPMPPIDKFD